MRKIWRLLLAACALLLVGWPVQAQDFDSQKDFDYAQKLLTMTPEGPQGKPWEQHLGGHEIDTSKYKKPGPYSY